MVHSAVESPWRSRRQRPPERHAKTEAVLQAAARLFHRQGFHGTSLDDIARSLGVSKPTLYYYVASKEQLLFACVERGVAQLRAGFAELAARGVEGRERLRAAMALYAEIVTSDLGLCVIHVGEDPLPEARRHELRALKGQVDAEFRQLIEQGMAAGWIAPGDAAMAAFTVVGALSGIGRWYRPDVHGAAELQEAKEHGIDMLMRGVLGAPAAREAAPAPAAMPFDAGDPAQADAPVVRRERHFEQRMFSCFAQRPMHVAQLLVDTLQRRPDAEALVAGELRLSWRELHHAVTRCAGGLGRRGVAAGDRVALTLGNEPEFVIAVLACAWLGAVAVPISSRAAAAELTMMLQDAEPSLLIAASALVDRLPAPDQLPRPCQRFIVGAAFHLASPNNLMYEYVPAHLEAGVQSGRFRALPIELAIDLIGGFALAAIARLATGEAPADYPEQVAAALLVALGLSPKQAEATARAPLERLAVADDSLISRATARAAVASADPA